MDWILFFIVFAIINKFIISPLFWFKKNNSKANKLLALLILLSAFPMVSNYIIYTDKLHYFPYTVFIYQMLANLIGPVLYFYCMEMIGKSFVFSKGKLLHLLPALFPLIFWIDFMLLSPQEQEEFIRYYLKSPDLNWRMVVAAASPSVFALPYFFFASRAVYRSTSALKDVYTNIEGLKIRYIREFVTLMLLEVCILNILYAFTSLENVEMIWVPFLGNVFYFYIVYKNYNYSVIFSEKEYEAYRKFYQPLNEYVDIKNEAKYTGSTLSAEKASIYASQLLTGFAEQHWYLDPELNLKTVSEKSGISTHYISQVINQQFGKNFFDYVNSYRIEALKQKLTDPSQCHITIEGMAYMSGFNSKAAFQRAFKKYTGMLPKEYRNQFDRIMA